MNHNALVDLTGSSDEEPSVQSRPTISKRLKLYHNSRFPTMRGSNSVDLTLEEQDYPYLQSGTLGSPFPRSLQKIYRAPILVEAEPEINQAPVYKDIGYINGALMEFNERHRIQMPDSRSPIPDKRQEDIRTLQQPLRNARLSLPPPPNAPSALTEDEKTLVQDFTNRPDTAVVTSSTSKETQVSAPRIREDLRIPSPIVMSYAPPDAETQPADAEEPKEVPLTLEAFQSTFQDCLHDLRVDHQYYVKSRLAHARRHHTSYSAVGKRPATALTGETAGPTKNKRKDFLQKNSPFTNLAPVRRDKNADKPGQQWTGKLCQLGAKATKQGPEITTAPCIAFSAGQVAIPPYTNYISTKRNILIEDDKNRTFLLYYGDDASVDGDYAKLESQITQKRSYYHHTNSIAEKAKLYGPYAESFLAKLGCDVSMVLRYLLDETNSTAPEELTPNLAMIWLNRGAHLKEGYYDDSEESDTSKRRHRSKAGPPQNQWQVVINSLPTPSTSRAAAAAGIACAAFANVLEFSLWHVVKRHRLVLDAVSRKHRTTDNVDRVFGAANGSPSSSLSPARDSDPLGTYADLGCLVCYAHECPGHGEFEDGDDEKNIRIRINAKPPSPKSPKHKQRRRLTNEEHIGVTSSSLEAAVGINEDKIITGKPWAALKDEDSGFKDDELCSDECFWLKSNRSMLSSSWADHDLKLFNTLLPGHQGNRRGSCLLALGLSKPCYEPRHSQDMTTPFLKLLDPHLEDILITGLSTQTHGSTTRGPPSSLAIILVPAALPPTATAINSKLHVRRHACVQTTATDVTVAVCVLLVAGSVGKTINAIAIVLTENATRIFVEAVEHMKYWIPQIDTGPTWQKENVQMCIGGVSGWGLYMGEATKKGDYIGEYVGEVISKEESEQRGIIYNKRSLSYLFDLNSTQTLDSTLVGNKLRYINHQAPPYANCQAKTLFCNTVHRIGMFACRNIEVGEEILFDYGEGFAAKFDLIKLDDQAQPMIEPRRKTVAHKINKDPDRAPTLSKNGKRIGRPRKTACNNQGVKESATMVETMSELKTKVADTVPKRSHKRKRPPSDLGLDGAIDDANFENALPSDDAAEDPSSESFHWSDDEEEEFKVSQPALFEAARKRGWRSKISSRGRRRGRGHGKGTSVVLKKTSKIGDRDSDAHQEGSSSISQERREKNTFKTHRNHDRGELRKSGKGKGKEREARDHDDRTPPRVARTQLVDRLKKGFDEICAKHRRRL
ncbi:hypothetical protein MMC11_005400 [Xylographa trunciseda]|nr:hypothetical protein [Xylographa trunciseda]